MFKQILELINRMLLFVAVFILVLGVINSLFGTNLGIKIGGDRIALPKEFLAVVGISILLVILSGLLSLALNAKKIIGRVKAEPLKVGGSILVGITVLGIVGYFGVIQLAGGPLTFAVERGDHAAVKEILADEVYDQEALDSQLYFAVANGDYDIAITLIEYGADVDHTFGEFESPLLTAAVHWYEVGATEFLLQQGADPNQTDNMGRTPMLLTVLYRASAYSDGDINEATDIVIALMAAGADPLIAAANGDTVVGVSERSGYTNILASLDS